LCAVALVTAYLTLQSSGCDIFQTRTPQPPTQTTSSFSPPVTPEIVLSNLTSAVAQDNIDNYMRSFPDSITAPRGFLFTPSPEVAANYSSVFRAWSLTDERTYFQNLGKPNGTPLLSLSNEQKSTIAPDSVVYTIDYTLYFPHGRSGVPELVGGQMQFGMRTDAQQLWAIYSWQDFKTTSDSTWSYLKAVFSGG
jgi:hypothetical protein